MKYLKPDWVPDWVGITADGRVSWYDGGAKGVGTRRQKRCGDTEKAEVAVRALMKNAERTAGLQVGPGVTWADICQAWTDAHDGLIVEGTMRRRLTAINAWIVPNAGTVTVGDTSLSTLLLVGDALVSARTGRSNFDSTTQAMSVIADWARERDWLPADPFGSDGDRKRALRRLRRKLADPSKRASTDDDGDQGIEFHQVPTWKEVVSFADAVADRVGGITKSREIGILYGRAIRVAAGTGLRQCELLALTAERVDMTTGLITVDRQLDRYTKWEGGEMPTAAPKYDKRRQVLAWDKVRADLKALIEAAGDDGILIPPFAQQAWWADAWGRTLHASREAIGWGWPPHWLRHHYGSFSVAPREVGGFGLSHAEVQHSLGHKSLTTTLETYIQPTRSASGWVK